MEPLLRALWSRYIRAVRCLLARVVVVHRVLFFETDLTQALPAATARIPLEIRPAMAADIEAFTDDLKAAGLSVDNFRARLRVGEVPIIAVSSGRLTHIHWLVFEGPVSLGELGFTLHLRPGDAYNSYAVTLPGWRGKGIHPAVSSFINRTSGRAAARATSSTSGHTTCSNLKVVLGKLRRQQTKRLWCVWLFGSRRPWIFGRKAHGVPRLERAAAKAGTGVLAGAGG